jgi:hypothetical protein
MLSVAEVGEAINESGDRFQQLQQSDDVLIVGDRAHEPDQPGHRSQAHRVDRSPYFCPAAFVSGPVEQVRGTDERQAATTTVRDSETDERQAATTTVRDSETDQQVGRGRGDRGGFDRVGTAADSLVSLPHRFGGPQVCAAWREALSGNARRVRRPARAATRPPAS